MSEAADQEPAEQGTRVTLRINRRTISYLGDPFQIPDHVFASLGPLCLPPNQPEPASSEERGFPKLEEQTITVTADVRPKPFVFLTAEQITNLPPPKWRIEGLIADDTLAVVYGSPGAGKSFLALEWALAVAAGQPTLGHAVAQGDTVYIYAEGGGGFPLRIRAWQQRRGKLPARFFGLGRPVGMPMPGEVTALIRDVRAAGIKPALIVIDTLARCFGGGDENTQRDMNAFVAGCDKLRGEFPGVAVLVVHHTGWDASRERGSNALRAASDTVLAVNKTKDGSIRLTVERQKDAPMPDKPSVYVLEKVAIPDAEGSCVVELASPSAALAASIDEKPKGRAPAKSDASALAALKATSSGGLTFAELQKQTSVPKSTLRDALRRLEKRGKAIARDNRWFIADPAADGLDGSEP